MDSYVRVKIKGTLKTLSALHINSGEEAEYKDKENESRHYAQLCLNAENKPFVPASTIRGVLRGFAEQHDQKMLNRLFGYNSENDENRASGKLRFYDAPLFDFNISEELLKNHENKQKIYKNQGFINFRTKLNPVLGVAEETKLFASEYVPAGSTFEVELEADEINETDVKDILGLLKCFDGSEHATLGKGISQGQGRVEWKCEKISYLDIEKVKNWLNDPNGKLEHVKLQPIEFTRILKKSLTKIEIQLNFSAPFLVNDAYLVKEKNEDNSQEENEKIHDLEFSRLPNGKPIIPASSLRGALRGQCQKILNTKLSNPPTLDKLFGTTEQRSLLWITDAVGNSKENHEQMFNAIDRFTGGAKEGALYQVLAADNKTLKLTISLEERQALEEWEKGLLLLVARDTLEGDLACGWGKARGFGAFKATLFDPDKQSPITTWKDLIEKVGIGNATNWLDAFDKLTPSQTP